METFKTEFEKENKIKCLRQLKNVERLNGKYKIQRYTVAEHCYYTGILFEHFAEKENVYPDTVQRDFVYKHDILESITGDILRPAKSINHKVKEHWRKIEMYVSCEYGLSEYTDEYTKYWEPKTRELFEACDILELYLYCKEEHNLGNRSEWLRVVLKNCVDFIDNSQFESIKEYIRNE